MSVENLKTRTWPYGTTKQVQVLVAHQRVVMLRDKEREGYVLLWPNLETMPTEGDYGVITFTEGGPTGGYWKYEASNTQASGNFSA